MASYIDNLTTARDNFAARLAEISANPKPDYNIDGQSMTWTAYYRFLSEQVERLNAQLAAAEPFEIQSRGDT